MTVIINESEGWGCEPSVPGCSPQWEQSFRLLGGFNLARAGGESGPVEFIGERKVKPASFLDSDGRADGRAQRGRCVSVSSNSPSAASRFLQTFSCSRFDRALLTHGVFWLKIHTNPTYKDLQSNKVPVKVCLNHKASGITGKLWWVQLNPFQYCRGIKGLWHRKKEQLFKSRDNRAGRFSQRPKINCAHCPL